MSGERLAVVLLTAHRLDYAIRTAMSTARNLRHDGPVHWHIADDGDDDGYIYQVADAIVGAAHGNYSLANFTRTSISTSQAAGRGYGASFNLASQVVHSVADYVLPLEDDWELLRPLDTTPIMRMLACGGHQSRDEWQWAVPPPDDFYAQSVRLGYLGYQWPIDAHLFKTDESLWMALDPTSPDQNVAAGHPRIETVAYQRAVGPWDEGLNPGATELGWVQRPAARRGVVWPLTLVSLTGSISGDLFAHIGATKA